MADNNPKEKQNNVTLAELLKSARQKKKLSVEELANAASLSVRDMERLEKGEYDRLPAEIYVQNFLERCARELNMSAEELISAYRSDTARLNLKNKSNLIPERSFPRKRFVMTPKIIFIAACVIGVLALVGYFWYQLSWLLRAPVLTVDNPPINLITNEETILVSGRTSKDTHVFVNGREIEMAADSSFRSDFHLEEGMNSVEVKSVNRFGKETVVVRQVVKEQ